MKSARAPARLRTGCELGTQTPAGERRCFEDRKAAGSATKDGRKQNNRQSPNLRTIRIRRRATLTETTPGDRLERTYLSAKSTPENPTVQVCIGPGMSNTVNKSQELSSMRTWEVTRLNASRTAKACDPIVNSNDTPLRRNEAML